MTNFWVIVRRVSPLLLYAYFSYRSLANLFAVITFMFCQLLKTCEKMSEEMSENKSHLKSTFGMSSSVNPAHHREFRQC